MNNGFLTINDYSATKPHFDLFKTVRKGSKKINVPLSVKEIKEKYIEYAIFYLSDYGVYQNEVLEDKPTWQLQGGVESPKFCNKIEGTHTIILTVEKVDSKWSTNIPNAKNDGLYRVLYNDGDDTYHHAFFATQVEALDCFKYIMSLPFNYFELFEVLSLFNFWTY